MAVRGGGGVMSSGGAVTRNNPGNIGSSNMFRQQRHFAPSVASLQLQKSTTVSKFLTFFQRKNTVVVEI